MGALEGTTIGFIGLGLMGRPMSRNLAAAGAHLVIHNRSRAPLEALAAEGMEPAGSPAEVAARAETVIVMVADSDAVRAVIGGPAGILERAGPATLVIDMGTTAVAVTRELGARLAERGAELLDAPVSGGEVGAREASLSIMAGGSEPAFARALPIFEVLGRNITHVGGLGAGQTAKAANQVIVGLTIGAVAEALALARAAGVDPARVREALMGGFAGSRILELHGQRMIEGEFRPGGKVVTQRKDMRQALELGEALGLELPATRLNLSLYERLVEAGDGELDHSALYRLYSPRD